MSLPKVLLALVPLLLTATAAAQENILLLIGDDLGVERVGAYGEHSDPGRTPNLDRLAARGILFRNAWSTPYCSPTRATMLTGRQPFRTGVGAVIQPASAFRLSVDEITLPELLRDGTGGAYHSAAIGKWHLSGGTLVAAQHPLDCGFDFHSGSLHNIDDYFSYPKSVNGAIGSSDVYATSDTTNDAIRARQVLPEPWFLWVAYNAPHKPHHAPPASLTTYTLSGNPDDTPALHVKAMIEAMDAEIGRLLSSIPPDVRQRTTVIFVGDNGTYGPATDGPFADGHAKGTCFEGGINVPLIVDGPHVRIRGSESAALVDLVDVYSTVAEIAGVDPASVLPPGHGLDSISLLPYLRDPARPSLRHVVYTERFTPNGSGPYIFREQAVRNERYKVIRRELTNGPSTPPTVTWLLFDLVEDPLEESDLLLGAPGPREREEFLRLRGKLLAP